MEPAEQTKKSELTRSRTLTDSEKYERVLAPLHFFKALACLRHGAKSLPYKEFIKITYIYKGEFFSFF